MSNYSFMKSGFDNINSNEMNDDMLDNLYSLIYAFMEKSMISADTYVKHSKREIITKEDIQLALKYETFKFLHRPNIFDDVSRWKEILLEEIETEEAVAEDTVTGDLNVVADDKDYVAFTKSECICEICAEINDIEEKWDTWVPHNQIEIILKNAVLKI